MLDVFFFWQKRAPLALFHLKAVALSLSSSCYDGDHGNWQSSSPLYGGSPGLMDLFPSVSKPEPPFRPPGIPKLKRPGTPVAGCRPGEKQLQSWAIKDKYICKWLPLSWFLVNTNQDMKVPAKNNESIVFFFCFKYWKALLRDKHSQPKWVGCFPCVPGTALHFCSCQWCGFAKGPANPRLTFFFSFLFCFYWLYLCLWWQCWNWFSSIYPQPLRSTVQRSSWLSPFFFFFFLHLSFYISWHH